MFFVHPVYCSSFIFFSKSVFGESSLSSTKFWNLRKKVVLHTSIVARVKQERTTQLAKMSIDPKFVELTAGVVEIFV